MKKLYIAFILALVVMPNSPVFATEVNSLQQFMFYRSFVQDDAHCSVSVKKGHAAIGGAMASSAAASCPDAFAWTQLVNAISDKWWNWGIDQTVWPGKPLPLCSKKKKKNCCNPNAKPGRQPTQCPVFRADYQPISPLPATPNGTPSQPVINHRGLVPTNSIDPGRLLRDLELELVFRNKPMVDYIYRNDLYSLEGLGARNRAQNAALQEGDIAKAHALEVRFPVNAVMVKADFIHQKVMLESGLIKKHDSKGSLLKVPNNPKYPYLTVKIDGDGSEGSVPGVYYLVAMTNASKELPIWHWYAMEHVANLGRCDYIGCNDSFGYRVNGTAQPGADFGSGFIPPKMTLNNDKTANNDPVFVTGKFYDPKETGETISPELKNLLDQLKIGTDQTDKNPYQISRGDPAWLSYRLKGTQTNFTTSGGVPTGMGATVTEGGFVNSASCTTCHAQASVDKDGLSGIQGVGASWRLNLLGYNQVEMGAPNAAWFYANSTPSITATQIDFIWGILNAACQSPNSAKGSTSPPCKRYPKSPTIVYPSK